MLSEHGMLFFLSIMHSYFESMTVSCSWFNNHISEGQLVCSLYTFPKIFLYHHKSFLSDLVALLSLSLFLPTPTLQSPILYYPIPLPLLLLPSNCCGFHGFCFLEVVITENVLDVGLLCLSFFSFHLHTVIFCPVPLVQFLADYWHDISRGRSPWCLCKN